ncbi:hypothetical protein BGX26_004552 [Mortierella sp. AD094]|nr:hypothetical protein BGX26_004552 [Mortierella sp. AD094]
MLLTRITLLAALSIVAHSAITISTPRTTAPLYPLHSSARTDIHNNVQAVYNSLKSVAQSASFSRRATVALSTNDNGNVLVAGFNRFSDAGFITANDFTNSIVATLNVGGEGYYSAVIAAFLNNGCLVATIMYEYRQLPPYSAQKKIVELEHLKNITDHGKPYSGFQKGLGHPYNQTLYAVPKSKNRTKSDATVSLCKRSENPMAACSGYDTLLPGDSLKMGDSLYSQYGSRLYVEKDANLCLYSVKGVNYWCLNLPARDPKTFVHYFLGDQGTLCYGDTQSADCFGYGGASNGLYRMTLQNDGNLVSYDLNGKVWYSTALPSQSKSRQTTLLLTSRLQLSKKKSADSKTDSDQLVLWHVTIKTGDADDDKSITLDEQPNPKKLQATSDISEGFGTSPAKNTTHVIVQRPYSFFFDEEKRIWRTCRVPA